VIVRLRATPTVGGAPGFSFGCGSDDGTSSCALGTVDAKSAHRQLQAQLTVPVTAATVKSVSLTAIGSAATLATDPKASAAIAVTTPTAAAAKPTSASPQTPETVTAPLPVGSLPNIPAASPTLSPGGNAAGLFPTLSPGGSAAGLFPTLSPGGSAAGLFPTLDPKPTPTPISVQKADGRPVADTTALPEGAPIADAQIAGLAALALAVALAVTRLSIRRRPGTAKAGPEPGTAAAAGKTATPPEQPEGQRPEAGERAPDSPPAGGE
jgi:hypothetical protein